MFYVANPNKTCTFGATAPQYRITISREVHMDRVLAYHLIITAYGFWLPNEPRGSWSDVVRSFELLQFGPATKVDSTESVAHTPYDPDLKRRMTEALAHKPVEFSGVQARAIARGFADYCERSGLIVPACSIMKRHTHLVVMRHTCDIEQVARLLKGAATSQLKKEALHPFKDEPYANGNLPSPWTRHCWAPFLWTADDIRRAIKYVKNNPVKDGLREQHWNFVTEYA
jgi:REP element-mobilizing transposase RayT